MNNTELLVVLSEKISQITAIEKRLAKLYTRFERSVNSPELSKALSPGETGFLQHLQRLKLIHDALKVKGAPKADLSTLVLQFKNKDKGMNDLQVIFKILEFQNLKLAHYEFLYPILMALDRQIEATMIEQTITENRNTNTWLRQILQNVIVPAMG